MPHRSTLLNIKTAAAELVQPLVKFFADEVRKDDVVGTDDTGVTLLLPKVLPAIVPNDVRSQRIHEVLSAAFDGDKKHVKAKTGPIAAAPSRSTSLTSQSADIAMAPISF